MKYKTILFLSLLSFSFLLFIPGKVFSGDQLATKYKAYSSKNRTLRWDAETVVEKKESEASSEIFTYQISEESKGKFSGFKFPVRWKAVCIFEESPKFLRPINMERSFYNLENKLLKKEIQTYDYGKNEVKVTTQDLVRNKTEEKITKFKSMPVNRLTLALCIRRFIASGMKEFKDIDFVSQYSGVYKIYLEDLGIEEIDLNGKRFISRKIYLNLETGLFSPLEVFIPKIYVWHNNVEPFQWLRVEGPEEKVNSVRVIIEDSSL